MGRAFGSGSEGSARDETFIAYWHGQRLGLVVLTNVPDARTLDAIYNPGREDWLARPRPQRVNWRRASLRGRNAGEHHLAATALTAEAGGTTA